MAVVASILDFQSGNNFNYFYLQDTPIIPTRFRVNWPLRSGGDGQNRFSKWQPWWPFWISDWNDFTYFFLDLQVTPVLPTKLSQLAFLFGRRSATDFQDGGRGGHLCFQIRTTLANFDSTSHPSTLPSFESVCLSVQEKKHKIDFQNGRYSGDLGLSIGTILARFALQVTLILPTKFWANWTFGSGEEAQSSFSRWRLWRPYWISDRNTFSSFDLQVAPILPSKFRVNWPRGVGGVVIQSIWLTPEDARRTADGRSQ